MAKTDESAAPSQALKQSSNEHTISCLEKWAETQLAKFGWSVVEAKLAQKATSSGLDAPETMSMIMNRYMTEMQKVIVALIKKIGVVSNASNKNNLMITLNHMLTLTNKSKPGPNETISAKTEFLFDTDLVKLVAADTVSEWSEKEHHLIDVVSNKELQALHKQEIEKLAFTFIHFLKSKDRNRPSWKLDQHLCSASHLHKSLKEALKFVSESDERQDLAIMSEQSTMLLKVLANMAKSADSMGMRNDESVMNTLNQTKLSYSGARRKSHRARKGGKSHKKGGAVKVHHAHHAGSHKKHH